MRKKFIYSTKKILLLCGVLSCFMLLSGCESLGIFSPEINYLEEPIKNYVLIENIIYGKDKNVTFDLYQPKSLSGIPAEVVILLHGGGWTSGDKSFLHPSIDLLQKERKNLAIVNLNYRVTKGLYDKDLITTQIDDLGSVIRYLVYNADKYNIRKDNYRVAGASAGGHIALTYAYLTKDNILKTVIAASAPTELSIKELLNKSLWPNVEKLTGRTYSDSTDAFKKASPFFLATYNSPRTILLYGQKDTLVSSEQGNLLAKKLRMLRNPVQFKLYPDETHDMSPRRFSASIFDSYK